LTRLTHLMILEKSYNRQSSLKVAYTVKPA